MHVQQDFRFPRVRRFILLIWFSFVIGITLHIGTQTARAVPATPPTQSAHIDFRAPAAGPSLYLPFIRGGVPPAPPVIPMLIGAYAPGQDFANPTTVAQYLTGFDTWAGLSHAANKGHSIGADFKALEDPDPSHNVAGVFETLRSAGYTGFMNMSSGHTAADIANGNYDSQIHAWAQVYKTWIGNTTDRRAFIAPLQEMNLPPAWGVAYGCDAPNFKLAYRHIVNVFISDGVSRSKIWWAFAPNGWTYPSCNPNYTLADYYPGDDVVDAVAMSSYNQSCKAPWMTPTQVFDPYLKEIRTVTPNKPVFISQTASSSANGDKDQWLIDAYGYLLQNGVRAVFYFNGDKECDWAVYQPWSGGRTVQGYKSAVSASNTTRYIAPPTLANTVLPP